MGNNNGIETGYPDGRSLFAGYGNGAPNGVQGQQMAQQPDPSRQVQQQPQGNIRQNVQGQSPAYNGQMPGQSLPQGNAQTQNQVPQGNMQRNMRGNNMPQQYGNQPMQNAPQGQYQKAQGQAWNNQQTQGNRTQGAQSHNGQVQGRTYGNQPIQNAPQDYSQSRQQGGNRQYQPAAGDNQGQQVQQEGQRKKKISKIREALQSGAIMKAYSTTCVLSVNPVPGIDKVRWSIVQLGTNGKDKLDYYMEMDEMRRLCGEIDSWVAKNKFDNDNQLGAYQFVTGENGSNHLQIGKGNNGGVSVKIQITGRPYRILPLSAEKSAEKAMKKSYEELLDMSFYFKLTMGLIPCSRYYEGLVSLYWDNLDKRNNSYGNQ